MIPDEQNIQWNVPDFDALLGLDQEEQDEPDSSGPVGNFGGGIGPNER